MVISKRLRAVFCTIIFSALSMVNVVPVQAIENGDRPSLFLYEFLTESGKFEFYEDINIADLINELSNFEAAQLYSIANYNRLRTYMDDKLWANAYVNEEGDLVVLVVENRSEEAIEMIEGIPNINVESLVFEYTSHSRHDLLTITEFLIENAEVLQISAVAFIDQPIVYIDSSVSRSRSFSQSTSQSIIEEVLESELSNVSLDAILDISFVVSEHSLEIMESSYVNAYDFEVSAPALADSLMDTRNTIHTMSEVLLNNFTYTGNGHNWRNLYVTKTRAVNRDSGDSMFQRSGVLYCIWNYTCFVWKRDCVYCGNRACSERH